MRRLAVIAASLGALVLVATAPGAPAAPVRSGHAPYWTHLTKCHHALAPAARLLGVAAGIHAPAGSAAKRVGVRLHMLVRRPGAGGFSAYAPPPPYTLSELGLDTWVRSARGSRSLRYSKAFNNLDAPATYRFKVSFRFYGAHGKVLRTASRKTHGCNQPDLRPDLKVRNVVVHRVDAKHDRYQVFVRNRGKTGAGPFSVDLALGGHTITRSVADGLAAGAVTRVGFGTRKTCQPASPPVVTVDSGAAVAESDEADDVVPVSCP